MTLTHESGREYTHQEDILNLTLHFFRNLYHTSQEFVNWNRYGHSLDTRSNFEEYEALAAPLRDSEIILAIKSFKPPKAPGPDGLHPLIYQKY